MKKRTYTSRMVFAAIAILILLVPAVPAGAVPVTWDLAAMHQTSPASPYVEKAQAALAASEFTDAENQLRLAIAADPSYALSYAWMGQVFAAQPGQEKDALANGEKAAELAPKDSRVLALLADIQYRQDLPAALKTAEQAVQANPDDPYAQAALALVYTQDAQWEKARVAALKAVKLDPKLARAYHALGVVYDGMWDGARARRAMEQAVKLEPKAVRWHLSLGMVLANLGDNDGAAAHYNGAVKIVPDYPLALIANAYLIADTSYHEIAKRKVEAVVKIAPGLWQTRLLQGRLAVDEGNYGAAEAHYQRALAVSPKNPRIEVARARAKLDAEDCSGAKVMLEQLLETRPHLAPLHAHLSAAHLCLEDTRQALAAAEEAVRLDPYDPSIRSMLAHAQLIAGRGEDGVLSFALAGAVAPDPAQFILGVGQLHMAMEEFSQAETELALATRLGAADIDTLFQLCQARLRQDKFAEAADACGLAYSIDREIPILNQVYGVTLLASARPREAIPRLKEAISGDKTDPASHYWLALALMKTRNYKEALAEFKTYNELSDEVDQGLEQMVAQLEAGWLLKDAEALNQLGEVSKQLLDGRMKAKITGKTAKDRQLVLEVTAGAKDTPQTLMERTLMAGGIAAYLGSRIEPPIAGAVINGFDDKGKPFLTLTADVDGLQDIALGIVSGTSLLARFKIDSGAPGAQELTKEEIDQVGKEAAEVRGLKVRKPISVTMITQEQFLAEYEEQFEAESGTDDAEAEAIFRLLGVLGPDDDLDTITDDVMNEQVVGYYDSETEDLRVLKGKTPDGFQRLTLAHEYVHALQDQNFTVLDDQQLDSDASLAIRALVEGDASLAAFQYMDKKLAVADALQLFSDSNGELDSEALESAPEFLNQLFLFPYDAGQQFVRAAFARGGWKAVNELYARPPASTEQVLHPERYRGNEKPVVVKLPKVTTKLAAGWSLVDEEVVGELAWRALLQADIGPTFATEAAAGWGGDRYALLKDKNGDYALALRADWDTVDDQKQFSGLLRMMLHIREGFEEQTDDLLAENPVRIWQGPDYWWAIHSDGKRVLIGIAETREIVEKVLAALAG